MKSQYNLSPNSGQKITAYDEAITVEVFRQMTSSEAAYILQGYKQSGNSHEVNFLKSIKNKI